MANIKTSELTDAALNWAVAKCEGFYGNRTYLPSNNWCQGGPIIEKGMLCVNPDYPRGWMAMTNNAEIMQLGSTALIAAMRCYVASKLGNSVEIPDELINF